MDKRLKGKSSHSSRELFSARAAFVLHELAFDRSLLPHIISLVDTGQLCSVNTAACKLLGYPKKELLRKNRKDIFDLHEASYKKMLKERAALGQSLARVTLVKKDGRQLPCEITSAVFSDQHGRMMSITTIMDRRQSIRRQKSIDTRKEIVVAENIVLALQKSDDRLAESNEWLQFVAKTSYDVMWDWDIPTNVVWVGDSMKEVFGYSFPGNIIPGAQIGDYLVPEEKEPVHERLAEILASRKKTWKDSCMVTRQDGSVASTTSRASIIRDKQGKAIRLIGATQDVSKLRMLEKDLKARTVAHDELSELFLEASRLSFEGRWDWNLLTNEFFLGEGFKKLFGHTVQHATGNFAEAWSDYLHPDDKEAVIKGLRTAIDSTATHWEQSYRFICSDGSIAQVMNRATLVREPDGRACRMIGAMQDVSRLKLLEARLEQEMNLKERQIADASDEARETERSDIGKELHDNVNQLLGASQLYMNMAKEGGEDIEMLLARSSEYTQTAIEAIRKLTHALTSDILVNLGLREAMDNIVRDTMEIHPVRITCAITGFRENNVNSRFKMNIFRVVQEQLNNIIKHAKATSVEITLKQNKVSFILCIADNGVGFDATKKGGGIGLKNIKSRAASYNGSAEFISVPGKGCTLNVSIPVSELLLPGRAS